MLFPRTLGYKKPMKTLKASPLVLLPLTIIVVVAIILSLLYAMKGQKFQMIITLALALPLFVILVGWWRRRLSWDKDLLKYSGLLGTKEMPWKEIREVRLFRAGLKKVLYIGSKEKVIIVPLIFSHQEDLAQAFQERLSLEELPRPSSMKLSFSETILLWTGALLLVIILATKLRG